MIVGIGIDVCGIQRWEQMAARRPGLVTTLLTADEASLAPASQAARFAAKEALAKALASPGGMRWHDAEVVRTDAGAPEFVLRGTVAAVAASLGVRRVHLSLSHDAGIAVAMVVCEGDDDDAVVDDGAEQDT